MAKLVRQKTTPSSAIRPNSLRNRPELRSLSILAALQGSAILFRFILKGFFFICNFGWAPGSQELVLLLSLLEVIEVIRPVLKLNVNRCRCVTTQLEEELHRRRFGRDPLRMWNLIVQDPSASAWQTVLHQDMTTGDRSISDIPAAKDQSTMDSICG